MRTQRETDLEDEVKRLTTQVESLQNKWANRELSQQDSDALMAENERLQARVDELLKAAIKTIAEQDAIEEHHSNACMNWSFCEHSQHQCGVCDLREAIKALEGEGK